MRTFTDGLPRWHQPALGAAVAVLVLAGLVAIPIASDDGDSGATPTLNAGPSSGPIGESSDGTADGGEAGAVAPGAAEELVADPAAPVPDDPELGGSSGAASSGASGTADAGTASGVDPASGAPLGATDEGVSAEAIKLGILLLNVGNVEKLGIAVGVDPEQQQQAWQAYVDELNEAGGIGGREVRPVYRQYDVTSNDSQRAACLAMTEDEKVFAVLDIAMTTANALCVAQEHETPLVTLQPMPDEAYAKAQGRLFTLFARGSRMWRNLANDLHVRGALKGKTIGILGDTAPGNPPTIDAFQAELQSLGYEVAHRSALPSDGSAASLPQASSQVPVEVQSMQRAGVDLVFMFTGVATATQFVQTADGQRYHPKYVVGDWNNAFSDTYVGNMPRSFDGTLITTNRTGEFRQDRPEPETEARCRKIVEARTGQELDRSTVAYNSTVRLCTLLEVFARGAGAAGAELTRTALGAGIQQIGAMPLATFGGGSYRAGKPDAADLVRTARFDPDCRCWMPVDEFRQVRHT